MGNLKPGDLCLLIKCYHTPEHVGRECVIVEGPRIIRPQNDEPFFGYIIQKSGCCERSSAGPEQLRKIDPPNSDFTPGDWELIPWSPYRVGEKA